MLPGRDVECRAAVWFPGTACARRVTDTLSSSGPLWRAERPPGNSCSRRHPPRSTAAGGSCCSENEAPFSRSARPTAAASSRCRIAGASWSAAVPADLSSPVGARRPPAPGLHHSPHRHLRRRAALHPHRRPSRADDDLPRTAPASHRLHHGPGSRRTGNRGNPRAAQDQQRQKRHALPAPARPPTLYAGPSGKSPWPRARGASSAGGRTVPSLDRGCHVVEVVQAHEGGDEVGCMVAYGQLGRVGDNSGPGLWSFGGCLDKGECYVA